MGDEPAPRDRARTFDLLWGRGEPPTRGPRPSLSVEAVVEAAIAIADAEGYEAASMRRVAERLGVTTMSLYRYVPGKTDLVELMFDAGVGTMPPRSETPDGWREGLAWLAQQMQTAFRRRPWLLRVPITGPPMGPNNVAVMDRALDVMRDTGLHPGEVLDVLLLIGNHARGEVMVSVDIERASTEGPRWDEVEAQFGRAMRELADTGRYPGLARLVASGAFEEESSNEGPGLGGSFEFGIERILDGVAALIATRAEDCDETSERDETADGGGDTCSVCGTPITQPETGRRRLYCSRACQQRAHRERSA